MAGTVAQATGLNALTVANAIISSARTATTYRKNCERLAEHIRLIGNLLETLKSTDLMTLPATKEPLAQLREALGKALELVESCREKSYLYMLAMGWNVVYRFRKVQAEIDRYLRLVPLISLVHESRMQDLEKGLQAVEEDKREYILETDEINAQNVVLKRDRTKKDANILENSLSRRYPDLEFREALQEENEKLKLELHRSQSRNKPKQCRMIEHLIEVTENVVNLTEGKRVRKLLVSEPTNTVSGYVMSGTGRDDNSKAKWQTDLFSCCEEPCLSLKTCINPCGTFSRIAQWVSEGQISQQRVISELMAYSLFCGCCCYTCWMRRKLRLLLYIEGGMCDDFLTHLLCCCCAIVQEWRELELRDFKVSTMVLTGSGSSFEGCRRF